MALTTNPALTVNLTLTQFEALQLLELLDKAAAKAKGPATVSNIIRNRLRGLVQANITV